ncbi:MAG: MFS transporter [Stellaceae bacterium]
MPSPSPAAAPMAMAVAHDGAAHPAAALLRSTLIGLIAFLTVVDLFATQAILPSLAAAYGVSPAAMGLAVNASTLGMAVAGIVIALFSRRIDRRRGIVLSLALLAIPTSLLAVAPDLLVFTALRLVQGLFMSAAFTLTLTYLAEQCSATETAGAFAGYITGNVASNLFGRLMSAAIADHLGLAANFYVFALLNLAGALLVFLYLRHAGVMMLAATGSSPFAALRRHVLNAPLRAGFLIGFCILFAFIGTFTYVNFVLVRAPYAVSPMQLGLVYLVFLPSVLTTPAAGAIVRRFGTRSTLWAAVAVAGGGLPLVLAPSLPALLAGLALIGIGTFFAQATATGFIGQAATSDRGAASGMYLASYFLGGLVGSAVLGQVYDRLGWAACVIGIGLALALAALLGFRLTLPAPDTAERR